MNYYQLWSSDIDNGNPMLCGSNLEKLGIKETLFERCQKIEFTSGEIVYSPKKGIHDGIPEDFLRTHDYLPIMSPRLIETLNANGIDNIQYIPVTVMDLHGKRYDGYKIANILTALSDTVDKEKSALVYNSEKSAIGIPGKIGFVWHYAIKGEKAAGHDIFRLKFDDDFENEYNNDIFVSERFRKIITENNFTGVTFSEITTV